MEIFSPLILIRGGLSVDGWGSGGRIIWTTTTGLSTIGHRSLGSVGGGGEGQGAGGGDSVTRAHCPPDHWLAGEIPTMLKYFDVPI